MSFCSWYITQYDLEPERAVWPLLLKLEETLQSVNPNWQIHLHAFAADRLPDWLTFAHINVDECGVDGRNNTLYNMAEVTGLNFMVQATLLSQTKQVEALLDAVSMIEDLELLDFAFVCLGGTHRSVGGILLLSAMAYPNAVLVLHTNRTVRAAESLGLTHAR